MSHYKAKQLLISAAGYYRREKESISKLEIRKKINEIKYLSAQKKVPKISLRKEIIHLENTLESVFELEKTLLKQKTKEAAKIDALKKEVNTLRKALVASKDKDLRKKVDKLTHVLGEFKAKDEIGRDVALSKKVAAERKFKVIKTPKVLDPHTIARVEQMEDRLEALKHDLMLHKEKYHDTEKITQIEQKIHLVEKSLDLFYKRHPQIIPRVVTEGKQTLLFEELPREEEIVLEKELPLPPPPRMG